MTPAALGSLVRAVQTNCHIADARGAADLTLCIYLLQMREKQKCARIYGVLEKQFHGYYEEAQRKQGKTGENLLKILETRLDNVVYRGGFAKSRDMARQLVGHGHIMVNGKKVDIPSYRVSPSDIVEVRPSSRELTPFVVAHAEAGERPRRVLSGRRRAGFRCPRSLSHSGVKLDACEFFRKRSK